MADTLELVGAVLVVVGVALYAFPLALIVTGLFLVAAARSLEAPLGMRTVRSAARTGR